MECDTSQSKIVEKLKWDEATIINTQKTMALCKPVSMFSPQTPPKITACEFVMLFPSRSLVQQCAKKH